ncbi:MAG: hypothetical protein ABJC19_11565 [Gemmatimonadota bacterium]
MVLGLLAACGKSADVAVAPAPTSRPTSNARAPVHLRNDWRASVSMQRADSLILTLPDGSRQLQRIARMAHFTVEVGTNNSFSATLDSISLSPAADAAAAQAIGTRWNGRVTGAGRIEGLQISRSSFLGDDLTRSVRSMIPPVPFEGLAVGTTWTDTTSGSVQVELFRTSERRVRRWSTAERTQRGGVTVYPVRVREDFEQVGKGSQSGREMTMTAQGSRTGYYYLTADGRVDGAVLQDSVAQFITIPMSRQTVPTMRYGKTTLHFASSPRGERP